MEKTIAVKTQLKKIAIQGYEGSFHQIAAMAYFNEDIDIIPARSFSDLITISGNTDQCDGGVMAIENSIAGSILSNYSLLQESGLIITGEVYLRIKQNLLALPGQTIEDIREVHSHPMALFQCRQFFKQFPGIKLIESEDTALSAKKINEDQLSGTGAIASDLTAKLFQLEILEEGIETVSNNYTRFLILSKKANPGISPGHNKSSLYFKVQHEPGSLARALLAISEAKVNLSKIQSFPVLGSEWQYYFHVDIEFEEQEQFFNALTALKTLTAELKIFGTYKKGRTE